MAGEPSRTHLKGLDVAAVAGLLGWFVAWRWLGGNAPLHAYTAPGVNSLTSQEGSLIGIGALVQALLIAAVAPRIAAAWSEDHDKSFQKVLARPDVLYAILGLLAAELALALAFGALDFHPITEDEKTYLYQARLLLAGRLTVPVAPEQAAFMQPFLVTRDGLVSGQYFWAQPAFVAIGEAVGLPWLAVGFEVAAAVFFSGKLAAEVTGDRRVGAVAAALVASSPLVVATAATLHSATLAVACSSAALFGIARLSRGAPIDAGGSRLGPTLALGIATGIALNNRLLDHAAVLAGAAVVVALRERGRMAGLLRVVRAILPAVVVAIPFMVILALANRAVTGSPWTTGYALFNGGRGWKTMGFGIGPFGVEHTVSSAAASQLTVWALLTVFLSGSPCAFMLLAPAVLAGRSRRLAVIGAGVCVCALYTLAYFFYCGASITQTGPVYFDALVPVIAGTIAVAAVDLHDLAVAVGDRLRRAIPSVLVAQTLAGLVVFWPSQVVELVRLRNVAASCEDIVAKHRITKGLVFVRHGGKAVHSWVAHPPLPRPGLDDDVLFVKQHREKEMNVRIAEAHARGRPIYTAVCSHTDTPAILRFDPSTDEAKPVEE